MKKLIIIGALLLGLALPGLAQDVVTPGMNGLQTRNALNTAFSELLGVVDTVNETIRVGGVQITANATEINTVLDGALVNVTELNRLVGIPGNIVTLLAGKENSLGNPSVDGYVPSKSTTGVVTWIPPGGGANYPEGSGIPVVVTGASWGTTITDNSTDWNAAAAAFENSAGGIMAADSTETSELNYLPWYSANELIDSKIEAIPPSTGSFLSELQSLGSDAIALPIGASQPMATNKALADGTAYWQSFYLPTADTITGIKFIQRTQGGYTAADSNCVALYSVSGTTYTRVAMSANNGDLWKGSGYSLQTVAFTSAYSATAGNYFVCMVYNQSAETTAPSIYCWNSSVGVSQLLTGTNAHRISGTVTSEGGPPLTEVAGDITAADVIYGIWFY